VLKWRWLIVLAGASLAAAACNKKSAKADPGAVAALEQAGSAPAKTPEGSGSSEGPVDTTPLAGFDLAGLSADKQQVFYKLIGSLDSPCGKAHNLRTSFTTDTSCKRAPFAVRYIKTLVEDEASEDQAREEYTKHYKSTAAPAKVDVSRAPHSGPEDAPIKLAEFYDYACPHCKAFAPILEQVMADEAGKVSEYFMMFPLKIPGHENSPSAAAAALAAADQGKFKDMHVLLFSNTPLHDHDHVTEYAKQLKLDMTKFEAAYTQEADHVQSDIKQGDALGVNSTPTLFINEHKYEGPSHPKYIEMWIDEELAVNR
jgi:protein-disulfide isomerase